MDRQPNTFLPDNVQPYEPFPVSNFERLFDGLDRQMNGTLRYVCGQGVVSGFEVQTDKTVSAGTVVVGGGGQGTWIGTTNSDRDISSLLVDGTENTAWAALIRVPTTGAGSWPGYEDTFTAGAVNVIVRDTAPPNAFKVGTITLDAGGAVTAVDNEVLDRPTILGSAVQTWRGSVTVTDVEAGTTLWVDVDHSVAELGSAEGIDFAMPGKVTVWNPKEGDPNGFVVRKIENARAGQFGFELVHHADLSYAYSGADAVRLYWTRTGIPE